MPDVRARKEGAKEDLVPWTGFEMPLFRGSLFSMNPLTLMKQFIEDVDRTFTTPTLATNAGFWSPAIEVKEKEGKFLVTAELPGLTKGDVKVHVTDEALILEGEKKHEKEEKREGYYHSERSYGQFYRSIPLPEGAQSDKVVAEFTNGVLEVSIPVAEAKLKRREIPVLEGGKVKGAGG
jgi:HSP20 family protein